MVAGPTEDEFEVLNPKIIPFSQLKQVKQIDTSWPGCSHDYGFLLETVTKNYEFYAATRSDREEWLKILGLAVNKTRQNEFFRAEHP
jgi:hypothetical protein